MKTNMNHNIIVKCNDIERAKEIYYDDIFNFYLETHGREKAQGIAQESLSLFVEFRVKGNCIHMQMHDFFYHSGRENFCGSTLFHPEIEIIEE